MTQELLKAFILIFIAEMGDKTQILAMAFATRFPVKKVLLGIFLGCLLNHGLAVMLGSFVSSFIPINTIQIVAGFAFVGFSLWTLKPENEEDEEDGQKSRFGPALTVALAFFIGELGDKTQLSAITLATDAVYPLAILGGTVSAMVVTGGMGIIVGRKLGDRIPEFAIKIIAASVFMFFGVTKLYQTLPTEYLSTQNVLIFAVALSVIVLILLRPTIARTRLGRESALKRKSRELYNYYHQVQMNINKICLGPEICGGCKGNNCIVGHTKTLIMEGLIEKEEPQHKPVIYKEKTLNKPYNKEQALEGLKSTLAIVRNDPGNKEHGNIHNIRKNFEMLLLGRSIEQMEDWPDYIRQLKGIDKSIADKVLRDIDN